MADEFGAHWEGLDETLDALEEMEDASDEAMAVALRGEGEAIKTDVQASRPGKGVPRDEGILASTLSVEGPDMASPGEPEVRLVAGGPAAPYALAQHERMDYGHDLGEARYWVEGYRRRARGGTIEDALNAQLKWLVARGVAAGSISVGGGFSSAPRV